MLGMGFLPDLIFGSLLLAFLAAGVLVVRLLWRQQRKAREHGYPSMGAYLRAAPRTDDERREAADLALKGVVICLLGLIFPPVLLIGLFPFFYGARKLVYASMGLGLIDGADRTRPGA